MKSIHRKTVAWAITASICCATSSAFADLPSFPGAAGFGGDATGGRAGSIYVVTNLNDSGAGSFRDAVSASNRIVVFAVSGQINLSSAISAKSNLTILGQTAPAQGIALDGRELSFDSQSNNIVQYIRAREGSADPSAKASINLGSTTNFILDHVSAEYSQYDNIDAVGTNGVNKLTIQNSMLADPIKAQQFNMHTEGDNVSYIANLWVNSHNRDPLAKSNTQYVNNVIYNYQAAYTTGNSAGVYSYDIINNYFIAGPSTTSPSDAWYQLDSNQSAYAKGNLLDSNKDGVLNGSNTTPSGTLVLASAWAPSTQYLPTLTAAASVAFTEAHAGDMYSNGNGTFGRDVVDSQVVSQTQSLGTAGAIYNTETSNGIGFGTLVNATVGANTLDTVPFAWLTSHGLSTTNAAGLLAKNPVGYAMIEQWAHEISDQYTNQTWTNASGAWVSSAWSSAAPGIYDHALIRGNGAANGAATISGSDNATAFSVSIGGNGPATGETLTVSGGLLNVQDTITVGDQNNATLNVSGGTVQATNIQLGNTVWAPDGSSSTTYTGNLNLTGGTLFVQEIVLGGGIAGNWTTGGVFNWNGGTVQAAGNLTMNAPATIGAAGATLDSNGYNGTLSGALTGPGTLTKIGSGVMVLSASNSYGGTVLQGGEIGISSDANIGGAASAITFNGGLLQINGTTLTNIHSHAVNWSTFNGGFDINTAANSFTVSDSIGGTGSFTSAGVGTVNLTGANTYSGGTTLLGGILVVSADANLGANGSVLNFAGGTLRITGTTLTNTNNHPLNTFGTGTFDINNAANTFTIAQQVNGTGDITKVGPGTLVFGTRDYLSGNLFLNAGTVRINDPLSLRYMTVNLFTPGTTLDFNGINPTIGSIVGNQTFSLQSVTAFIENDNSSTTFSGVITSNSTAGGLNKIGTGTLTLAGANTYTSPTTITSGVLTGSAFTNGGTPGPLGASSNAAANLVLNGGTLLGVGSTDRSFTLTANSTIDNSNIFNIGVLTGTVAAPAGSNFVLTLTGTSTAHNTLLNQIPDPAGGTIAITKSGVGKWTFAGGAKTYSGDTNVTVGTLESLSTNAYSPNSNMIIASGAIIDFHAFSNTINGLSGAGAVNDSFGTSQTFTIGAANGSGSFSGVISGPVTLNKNGTGAQTLSGANTFTNATNINAGTLTLAATGSLASTAYSVAPTGTFTLLAGASIPATAAIASNGTINFNASRTIATLNGTSTTALLTLNAATLTISSGGTYAGDIVDNATNGALTVNAPLSVGNALVTTLNVNQDLQITATSKANNLNLLGSTSAWTTGLDLAGNKFILEATPATKAAAFARLQNQVAFGATSTNGIFTSTALPAGYAIAVIDNAALTSLFTTFGGIAVDGNSLLVSQELLGDTNADGHVDLTDLSTILNNFGTTTSAWTAGNFDGASTIDLTDLSDVLNNFGLSNPNASAGTLLAPAAEVPEPATLSLLSLGAVAILRRRTKARSH